MHLSRPVVPALVLAVAAALFPLAPGSAATGPGQPNDHAAPAAEAALAHARALFGAKSPAAARRALTARPAGRDATLALRELGIQRDRLTGADRASADRLLARPRGNRARTIGSVRVHWTAGRVARGYVGKVGRTVNHVLGTYRAAGYRAPESDGRRGRGGRGLLDIYLRNLGSQGLYGYCTTDAVPARRGSHGTYAYCALDNDYREFPTHTPLQNLRVTAAHELFHAVQFAYDYYEDDWFMEATATWAEDELYDRVNDNLQYLVQSPLSQPGASMDHFGGFRQYGDWIFFRYLTERHPAARGGMPTLVRDLWRRADAATSRRPDDYSIEAVTHVLAARGSSLPATFGRFAAANLHPATAYDEGARYRRAPVAGRVTLSQDRRSSGAMTRRVDHLASATLRFNRGSGLAARRLRVHVDLPPTWRDSSAVLTVHRASGRVASRLLRLSDQGDATGRVAFGRGVRYVDVTMANGGTHYRCRRGTAYSCGGRSTDDNLPMTARARAIR